MRQFFAEGDVLVVNMIIYTDKSIYKLNYFVFIQMWTDIYDGFYSYIG